MFFSLLVRIGLFIDWQSDVKEFERSPLIQNLSKAFEAQGHTLSCWRVEDPCPDARIFWGLGPKLKAYDFKKFPKESLTLVIWEPPTVQPEGYELHKHFSKVFTWDDDLVDGKHFFKFHYPVLKPRISDVVPFEKKKFCTLIASRLSSKHPKELYSEREKTIRFFEDKPGEFDLYGRNWEKRKFKNYKGPIDDKISVLKGYQYCICYENTRDVKGYITEKIFDCFEAGVVPVYWGAGNVDKYIPPACFIDRRLFKTEDALYKFLKNISPKQYAAYLEAAESFLKSAQAQVFSENYLIETMTANK